MTERKNLAVVTGAARGIGRAIANRLAAAGYRLILVDLSPDVAAVAADLESGGAEVIPIVTDLTLSTDPVLDAAPAVDVLVNNAGITRDARLVNLTDGDFSSVLEVNLGAAYRLTQALIPRFQTGGTIVNLSSRSYLGSFGQYNYSMSKGALIGLTRSLALELAPRVRVNAVAPGLIGTEMTLAIPAEVRDKMIATIPLQRMGRPDEVAELVAFLASEQSSYLTGEVVVVGGGRSLI